MKAALRHGTSEPSLHYVITSAGDGITTTIVGNVDKTDGTQTISSRDRRRAPWSSNSSDRPPTSEGTRRRSRCSSV